MTWIPLLAAGWFAWTLGEYVMHRFTMHSMKGRGLASKEHLLHHAGIERPWYMDALAYVGVIGVGAAWWVNVHPAVGIGWVVGYTFYEVNHRRAHKRAPRNAYQRWLRHHHFHHHFGHPLKNHGVTIPLWDHVFGTYEAPGRVKVPRRMAMVWLVDDAGELRPEHASRYELVGRTRELDDADRVDAFANRAPSLA
jgi:sterol desaturase/sphingolipid hydroxylase (fatty acid hydroxylase superfamily)